MYAALKQTLGDTEADVVASEHCFRFCNSGPNVAVNGALLHHIHPADVARRVRETFVKKVAKKDAVGTRSIDELDQAIDELFHL